jgi:hypothetical protein
LLFLSWGRRIDRRRQSLFGLRRLLFNLLVLVLLPFLVLGRLRLLLLEWPLSREGGFDDIHSRRRL